MSRLANIYSSLTSNPGYTLMRGLARFETARASVSRLREISHSRRLQSYLEDMEAQRSKSVFKDIDQENFVRNLRKDGISFGLKLPADIVDGILAWTKDSLCFADRDVSHGFKFEDRPNADKALGKPILLGQYFNTLETCNEISDLSQDPVLLAIAAAYLKSSPTFVGANLWWTFPVNALEADRTKHAHVFHRDVDDFKFFKFFFYLTDVPPGEGAHVAVVGSHVDPPKLRKSDPWFIRRYTDAEISDYYPADAIKEICGAAGEGFAEDTLCIHKGSTPKTEPRLLLQLQFALYDHGVMHDRREPDCLRQVQLGSGEL